LEEEKEEEEGEEEEEEVEEEEAQLLHDLYRAADVHASGHAQAARQNGGQPIPAGRL